MTIAALYVSEPEGAMTEVPLVRVLLVDDQPLVRAGLKMILGPEDGFVIVGECADGAEAVQSVMSSVAVADVILMDVRMKGMDGPAATARIRDVKGAPPVLILTTFDDDAVLSAALRAGAAGFLLKDAPAEEIIRAVRAVAQGGAYLDPATTGRVLTAYRGGGPPPPAAVQIGDLTAREVEVLHLIGRGATNEEIADQLVITEATVKTHITRIFDKLGLRDRAAAIVFAFDHGLVQPST
jgi:DNA-binding NarL/FixJ family response regulator